MHSQQRRWWANHLQAAGRCRGASETTLLRVNQAEKLHRRGQHDPRYCQYVKERLSDVERQCVGLPRRWARLQGHRSASCTELELRHPLSLAVGQPAGNASVHPAVSSSGLPRDTMAFLHDQLAQCFPGGSAVLAHTESRQSALKCSDYSTSQESGGDDRDNQCKVMFRPQSAPLAGRSRVVPQPAEEVLTGDLPYILNIRIEPKENAENPMPQRFDVRVGEEATAQSVLFKGLQLDSDNRLVFEPGNGGATQRYINCARALPWIEGPLDLAGRTLRVLVYGVAPRATLAVDQEITFDHVMPLSSSQESALHHEQVDNVDGVHDPVLHLSDLRVQRQLATIQRSHKLFSTSLTEMLFGDDLADVLVDGDPKLSRPNSAHPRPRSAQRRPRSAPVARRS